MLNIDDRLLEKVNRDQYWLLSHLAVGTNKNGQTWPSIATLAGRCKMSQNWVRKVMASLVKDGFVKIKRRKNNGKHLSNIYNVDSTYITVYVGEDQYFKPCSIKGDLIPQDVNHSILHSLNHDTAQFEDEVLITEVLYSTSSAREPILSKEELQELDSRDVDAPPLSAPPPSRQGWLADRAPTDKKELISSTVQWYKDNPFNWDLIRKNCDADEGELTDPTKAVEAAAIVLGEAVLANPTLFRRKILGFARKQLRLDRQAKERNTRPNYGFPPKNRKAKYDERFQCTDNPKYTDYSDLPRDGRMF
ncbi:MAG: helix-turn-helix domain-containing protein [Bacteroidota bacterium]